MAVSGDDGDGDGVVDQADYGVWRGNFGKSSMTGQSLVGDYNTNGVVDAADYVAWRHTLGISVAKYAGADGDGSGVIDQNDYSIWRAHFGEMY